MYTHVFLTSAGWVAAGWVKDGLSVLILPQEKREIALQQLESRLKRWGYNDKNDKSEEIKETYINTLQHTLANYLQGFVVAFKIPIDLSWCTPFQRKILEIIKEIPYGKTYTYSQVAMLAGYPGAARAVGKAAATNRTPLVIPCHRVIMQNGDLGGFSYGIEIKKYLLTIEQKK